MRARACAPPGRQFIHGLRLSGIDPGTYLLGRALLDCATLDEAVKLLDTSKRAGAFHMTLAKRGDPRLLGIEFTYSGCSVITIDEPRCHANHLVHPGRRQEPQVVTGSSRSRQRRGDAIIAGSGVRLDPLSLLRDKGNPVLPIFREQPDDPDHENTLATAVFHVGATSLRWRVYDNAGAEPRFTFDNALTPSTSLHGGA